MVPKIFKNMKMRRSIPKLPPMSMMMGKQESKENINLNWFKDFNNK